MKQHSTPEHFLQVWLNQLNREYERINWAYGLKLTKPSLLLIDASSYWGQWDPLRRELKISINLIRSFSWSIVIEVLKHEIAHQLTSDRLGIDDGHGPYFQNFCDLLGIDPRFRSSKSKLDLCSVKIGTPDWSEKDVSNEEEDRLLSKVARLLSLAQSSEEQEALRAMEKVSQLYERYNLKRLQTRLASHHDFLVISLNSKKVSSTESLICSLLSEHFFVEPILSDIFCAKTNEHFKTIEIFGETANLKMAEYVFYFLKNACQHLWQESLKKGGIRSSQKRSFELGLLNGFSKKLAYAKQERQKIRHSFSESQSLITLETDPELFNFIKSKHPRLHRRRRSSRRIDAFAYSKGEQEGQKLILNKGLEAKESTRQKASVYLVGPLRK